MVRGSPLRRRDMTDPTPRPLGELPPGTAFRFYAKQNAFVYKTVKHTRWYTTIIGGSILTGKPVKIRRDTIVHPEPPTRPDR